MGTLVKASDNEAKTKLKEWLQTTIDSLDNERLQSFHINVNPIFNRGFDDVFEIPEIESVEYTITYRITNKIK